MADPQTPEQFFALVEGQAIGEKFATSLMRMIETEWAPIFQQAAEQYGPWGLVAVYRGAAKYLREAADQLDAEADTDDPDAPGPG